MRTPSPPALFGRSPDDREAARPEAEVVELELLLPRWQADALELAARRRGMTTGQMLRRCIGEMLTTGRD